MYREPRFEAFKIDRHWLVHHPLVESGDDLFNEGKRESVFRRVYSIQEEAIALKRLIAVEFETWLARQGVNVKEAAEQGEAAY